MFFKTRSDHDCDLLNTILVNLPTHRIKKIDIHWEYISNGRDDFEGRSEVYRPRVSVELYEGTYD
jgi:hypothetical protein